MSGFILLSQKPGTIIGDTKRKMEKVSSENEMRVNK